MVEWMCRETLTSTEQLEIISDICKTNRKNNNSLKAWLH